MTRFIRHTHGKCENTVDIAEFWIVQFELQAKKKDLTWHLDDGSNSRVCWSRRSPHGRG
jgi:hypothetical protein